MQASYVYDDRYMRGVANILLICYFYLYQLTSTVLAPVANS